MRTFFMRLVIVTVLSMGVLSFECARMCEAQNIREQKVSKKIRIAQSRSMSADLQGFLKNYSPNIKRVFKDAEKYGVQIVYTEIKENNKEIKLIPYTYRVDNEKYFYPASGVKISTALLAFEKMYELGGIQQGDILRCEKSKEFLLKSEGELLKYIELMIKKSDNESYNRLYEFIGQNAYNSRLKEIGLLESRINHRFMEKNGKVYSDHENKITNEVTVIRDTKTVLNQKCMNNSKDTFEPNKTDEKKFLFKNKMSIMDLQKTLIYSIYEDNRENTIKITHDNRDFLRDCLKGEGTGKYKYFMCGGKGKVSSEIEIYNKIGRAYGYLIDNAYIVDKESREAFFLTAVIKTGGKNPRYGYDKIGMPFLKDIGNGIYDYKVKKVQ